MKKIRCLLLSIWHGHKFKIGYSYKKINHSNLDLLERHHIFLKQDGWEKDSDIKAGFMYAWVWYKKPRKIVI